MTSAFQRHRAQLDVTRGALPWSLAPTALVLAAGAVTAAIFGSGALRDWAFELSFAWGQAADPIFHAADLWHGWMDQIGATRPHEIIRDWMQALRYVR